MKQSKEHKYMKEWIDMYNQGMSFRQIAKDYNVAMTTVKRRIKEHVEVRPKSKYMQYADEWLELFNSGMKKAEIARRYNVNPTTVGSILSKVGVKRNGDKKFLHLLDEMKSLYSSGKSLREISDKLNLSPQLIAEYLEFDDFERRPYSAACRNYAINDNLFESIDTTEKAFSLGIVFGIGNIVFDGNISRNVRLVTTNEDLMSFLIAKIYKNDTNINFRKTDHTYRKDIQCDKIKDDLIKLGFSNKGNKQVPIFKSKELKNAFIDGLVYSKVSFSESKVYIKSLDKPLKELVSAYLIEEISVDSSSIKGVSSDLDTNKYKFLSIYRKSEIEKIKNYYNEIKKIYHI